MKSKLKNFIDGVGNKIKEGVEDRARLSYVPHALTNTVPKVALTVVAYNMGVHHLPNIMADAYTNFANSGLMSQVADISTSGVETAKAIYNATAPLSHLATDILVGAGAGYAGCKGAVKVLSAGMIDPDRFTRNWESDVLRSKMKQDVSDVLDEKLTLYDAKQSND